MICLAVPVTCRNDAERALIRAQGRCDIVELRIDHAAEPGEWLEAVVGGRTLPAIVTDRCPAEGGRSPRTQAERLDLLARAAAAGAEYIDCEYRALAELPVIPAATRVIGSYHDFKGCPDDLDRIFRSIEKSRADVVKVAVQAVRNGDNFRLFKAMRKVKKPVIGICMGPKGEMTRILGRRYGNILTYAADDDGTGTAPGQVTVRELREVYRYKSITPATRVFGVAGNPIGHSASPAIHNAAMEALGIDAVYVKFLVDDMHAFMRAFRAAGFEGLSVTLPHKVALMECVDEVDELSRQAGAANTVFRKGKKLACTNTDIRAAVDRLADLAGGLTGKRVAVLGAGGAARGIVYGLRQGGADILIVNRTVSRAEELAATMGCRACGYPAFTGDGIDIVVNTTSVGMHPDIDASPVEAGVLRPGMIVFDAIYNPPDTKLIRMARDRGCRTLTGVDMFLAQGEEQFRIWFGRPAPQGVMAGAFARR
ncbi:MAG: shikimate dehydrogenase [Planctomycetota bacterium]